MFRVIFCRYLEQVCTSYIYFCRIWSLFELLCGKSSFRDLRSIASGQIFTCMLIDTDEILSDDANETPISSVMLPSPELGNLTEIEAMIRSASSTNQARDSLGKFVLSEDFIRKLIPLLEMAEDLESLENLHRLCNIMKMIILLNDTLIIEHIVTDEVIFGVVGILECAYL